MGRRLRIGVSNGVSGRDVGVKRRVDGGAGQQMGGGQDVRGVSSR